MKSIIRICSRPIATAALFGCVLHAPASAKQFESFSGSDVTGDETDYDGLVAREHEEPGVTVMGLNVELVSGDIYVSILNPNWTVKEKDVVEAGIAIDGVEKIYLGMAVGFLNGGKRGLVMTMTGDDQDFLAKSARGSGVKF